LAHRRQSGRSAVLAGPGEVIIMYTAVITVAMDISNLCSMLSLCHF